MTKNQHKTILAIIGTGRSGTHMVGNLLGSSPYVTASIEDEVLFPLITKVATQGPTTESVQQIKQTLIQRLSNCETKVYLEKSHPLLWLAALPEINELPIKFIGVKRNPYAVVASMLKKKGVRRWAEEWEKLPQPNIFLGTSNHNLNEYSKMSLTEKCVMRWVSHTRELDRLNYILGKDRYLQVNYEDLIHESEKSVKDIEVFTGAAKIDGSFRFDPHSLRKWQDDLTPNDVYEISQLLNKLKLE